MDASLPELDQLLLNWQGQAHNDRVLTILTLQPGENGLATITRHSPSLSSASMPFICSHTVARAPFNWATFGWTRIISTSRQRSCCNGAQG